MNAGDVPDVSKDVITTSGTARTSRRDDRDELPEVVGFADADQVHAAYARHGAELFRFVLRGLGDAHAAEDVVQEVFVKAWRFADRYDPEISSVRVWLFGIARNAMIDHARAAAVRPWNKEVTDPTTISERNGDLAEDVTERLLTSWVVEEALRRISVDHRTALVQTHLLERPYDEVAAELGIPVGTLRSRVFYGLKSLRVAMDEMGVST